MIYPLITLLIVALSAQFVQSDTCGRRATLGHELISNGINSTLGQWPWHSAVYHRVGSAFATYQCGGTIISRNFIVTAAHCTYPDSKTRPLTIREIEVVVGITDRKEREASSIQMSVAKIERHEDYNLSTTSYDIALLKLASELEFTDYVKPICLWMGSDGDEDIEGKDGYVPGWGRDENSELPDKLKHVKMLIVSRKSCQASDDDYYSRHLFDRMAFCAGYRDGTSVNSGDSGGGLYIEIDEEWKLRGIVSHGKHSSTTSQLDTSSFIVFTDVAHFRPWIQSRMGVRSPSLQNTEDYAVCGRKKESKINRIGFKEERKWPWQGEIYRSELLLCDVSLINEFFMLSPADVYSDKDISDPSLLRAVFQTASGNVLANYSISRVLRHENFTHHTRMNNIALLKLAAKVTFTRLLRPICLWSINKTVGDLEGHTGNNVGSLYDYNLCKSQDGYDGFVEGTFCFLQNNYIIQSDFIYVRYNGTWYLQGVIFNVVPHSRTKYNIAMLDMYRYKDWIENQQHQGHNLEIKLAEACKLKFLGDATYRVYVSGKFKCFSTMITASLLITTGFCVDGSPEESIFISDWDGYKPVRKVHLHPHFDFDSNNIAIIELEAPIETPMLLCLPTFSKNLSNYQTIMPGSFFVINQLDMVIKNTETCANRWRRDEEIQVATDGSHICANLADNTIEMLEKQYPKECKRHMEGMPLAYKVNDTFFMRGILDISLKNRCDHDGFSEVFLDVMFYADWIVETSSKCSSCHKISVSDDNDEQPMEEWRNVDPGKLFQRKQTMDTCGRRTAIEEEYPNYGSRSRLGEWPWHSAIIHRIEGSSPSYYCGGTIISRSYIVTAAYCTYPESKSRPLTATEVEVAVGITNLKKLDEEPLRKMSVAKIERYEDYDINSVKNEIALLQLTVELDFTEYVKPICLWMGSDGEEEIVDKQGYVASWGLEGYNVPNWLKHIRMSIVSQKDCLASDREFYGQYISDGKAFCAGHGNYSFLAPGFGGSGLYIEIDGKWQLRGIVWTGKIDLLSHGLDKHSFVVFTDVAHFRHWVKSKMAV